MSREAPGAAEVDLTLASIGDFECRPECALCCFATPAVEPWEEADLIHRDPATPLVPGARGFRHIADRRDGGACYFLEGLRCRVHDLRPFPCREFPLTVHLGARVQASLVLNCPGLDLTGLAAWGEATPSPAPGRGLEAEVRAVRAELARPTSLLRAESGRRDFERRARQLLGPRWSGELAAIREELGAEAPAVAEETSAGGEAPPASDGLDLLPLFYDSRDGRVAIAAHPSGWELLALREEGGVGAHLGVLPPPPGRLDLDAPARSLLTAYLRYWIDRDAFVGRGLREAPARGAAALREELRADLGAIAATAKGRAWARGRLGGRSEARLDAATLEEGIRATDADFLDRPTAGRVL